MTVARPETMKRGVFSGILSCNNLSYVDDRDNQLSLAIGKEGQNARLAAKLTGYKIDIEGLGDSPQEEIEAESNEEEE